MTARQGLIPLVHLFRLERPDVIFSTLAYFNFVLVAALKISVHWPRRIILREANSPVSTINALPLKWVGKFGYRHLYNCADYVICNASHVSAELIDLGVQHERICIIPNPVDVTEIHLQAGKNKSLPKFDDPVLPLFVSIGRLSNQKGMDRLIDWVRQMEAKANLLIIGDGPNSRSHQNDKFAKPPRVCKVLGSKRTRFSHGQSRCRSFGLPLGGASKCCT